MSTNVASLLRRAVVVKDKEVAALLLSFTYHFLVLAAYFVIRPIRDEMGVAGGVQNLPYLVTGTLIGMLLVHPIFTGLVSRYPRRTFITWIYRFFILNLVIFFLLFTAADAAQSVWVGRFFFIWTSVFNLFVVSVFWSFMTDVYQPAQGKRLFGMVAVGGTMGAITGSSITAFLVSHLGPVNLLLVSALVLEVAGRTSRRLEGHERNLHEAAEEDPEIEGDETADASDPQVRQEEIIGGGVLEGVRHVAQSPYLLGIAALMMFFTVVSTFLWMHLMHLVEMAFPDDPEGRTRLFAQMEVATQSLTLIAQIFLTGRILKWFGIGLALAFLPLVSLVGFGILATAPILLVAVLFQVFRRAGNFAVQRPAREVLYTVLPRVDKFKSKNFNDTFVYRLGDQAGVWTHHAMMVWMGLGLSAVAFAMVPFSAGWLVLALWLGKRYRDHAVDPRSGRREEPATRS
jgi:ATP:ADP antiporter, AAA family